MATASDSAPVATRPNPSDVRLSARVPQRIFLPPTAAVPEHRPAAGPRGRWSARDRFTVIDFYHLSRQHYAPGRIYQRTQHRDTTDCVYELSNTASVSV